MSTKLKFGNRHFHLPGSKPVRMTLGFLLILGGSLGFLPILGFWMVPLGLLILSVDLPSVRRFRRRLEVRWGRWRAERRAAKTAADLSNATPGLKPAESPSRPHTGHGLPPS